MAICAGQVLLPPHSKLSVYGFEVVASQPFTAALLLHRRFTLPVGVFIGDSFRPGLMLSVLLEVIQ